MYQYVITILRKNKEFPYLTFYTYLTSCTTKKLSHGQLFYDGGIMNNTLHEIKEVENITETFEESKYEGGEGIKT